MESKLTCSQIHIYAHMLRFTVLSVHPNSQLSLFMSEVILINYCTWMR